jgi:hypothetical protein
VAPSSVVAASTTDLARSMLLSMSEEGLAEGKTTVVDSRARLCCVLRVYWTDRVSGSPFSGLARPQVLNEAPRCEVRAHVPDLATPFIKNVAVATIKVFALEDIFPEGARDSRLPR